MKKQHTYNHLILAVFAVSIILVIAYLLLIPKEISATQLKAATVNETITVIPLSKSEMIRNALKLFAVANIPTVILVAIRLHFNFGHSDR